MTEAIRKTCVNPAITIANTTKILIMVLLASWLGAAIVFSLAEGTNLLDSLYWSMTTMTTVGFGDFSPVTAAGKIFTIVFEAWSIFFLVPCVVANIVGKVLKQEDKFTHDEQEWQEDSLQRIAAHLGVTLATPPADYDPVI